MENLCNYIILNLWLARWSYEYYAILSAFSSKDDGSQIPKPLMRKVRTSGHHLLAEKITILCTRYTWLLGIKTFLFVKIESWDFQHLFDFEFRETLQKLRSFKQHSENIFSIGIKSYLNELKSWKISRNKNWKKVTIHILPKRICIWLKYSWDLLSCLGIGDFLANMDVRK